MKKHKSMEEYEKYWKQKIYKSRGRNLIKAHVQSYYPGN